MKKFTLIILSLILLSSCGVNTNSQLEVSQSQTESYMSEDSEFSEVNSLESSSSENISQTPLSESSNTSQQTETKSNSETKKTWWQEGLSEEHIIYTCDPDKYFPEAPYSYFYIYDNVNKFSYDSSCLFARTTDDYFSLSLLLDTAKETDNIGERIYPNQFFEIVALDDTKYAGEFYEKGILLTQSLPGEDKGQKVMLTLEEKDLKQIIDNMNEIIKNGSHRSNVAWLSMMRRSRITSVNIKSSDKTASTAYDGFDNYIYEDLNANVTNARVTKEKSLPNAAEVKIEFNNGLVFNVYYTEKNLLIYANDIDFSYIYDLNSESKVIEINDYAHKRLNPRTAKPVIYLYPTKPTDCNVKVDYKSFTYTYPAYNNGWNVLAYPDGRLVNKIYNTEHYYLFWEGNEYVDWDFSEGFVVKGSDTENFLRKKLSFMGLTPREYNDFITYWVPLMKNSNYNLITFAKEQYEKLAPLTVSPTPDSVLRVHMVFKNIDRPIEIKEQKLEPFTRKGFTVIEWGGTNAN